MELKESREVYKGIFWIKDVDDIYSSGVYFTIPCDLNGNVINDLDLYISSNNGQTYNHDRLWSTLPSKVTNNKKYNYYPRGRVEINNGKAIIYCSPYIASKELETWCIDKFNLTKFNGIKSVRVVADGSNHYSCYLDNYV